MDIASRPHGNRVCNQNVYSTVLVGTAITAIAVKVFANYRLWAALVGVGATAGLAALVAHQKPAVGDSARRIPHSSSHRKQTESEMSGEGDPPLDLATDLFFADLNPREVNRQLADKLGGRLGAEYHKYMLAACLHAIEPNCSATKGWSKRAVSRRLQAILLACTFGGANLSSQRDQFYATYFQLPQLDPCDLLSDWRHSPNSPHVMAPWGFGCGLITPETEEQLLLQIVDPAQAVMFGFRNAYTYPASKALLRRLILAARCLDAPLCEHLRGLESVRAEIVEALVERGYDGWNAVLSWYLTPPHKLDCPGQIGEDIASLLLSDPIVGGHRPRNRSKQLVGAYVRTVLAKADPKDYKSLLFPICRLEMSEAQLQLLPRLPTTGEVDSDVVIRALTAVGREMMGLPTRKPHKLCGQTLQAFHVVTQWLRPILENCTVPPFTESEQLYRLYPRILNNGDWEGEPQLEEVLSGLDFDSPVFEGFRRATETADAISFERYVRISCYFQGRPLPIPPAAAQDPEAYLQRLMTPGANGEHIPLIAHALKGCSPAMEGDVFLVVKQWQLEDAEKLFDHWRHSDLQALVAAYFVGKGAGYTWERVSPKFSTYGQVRLLMYESDDSWKYIIRRSLEKNLERYTAPQDAPNGWDGQLPQDVWWRIISYLCSPRDLAALMQVSKSRAAQLGLLPLFPVSLNLPITESADGAFLPGADVRRARITALALELLNRHQFLAWVASTNFGDSMLPEIGSGRFDWKQKHLFKSNTDELNPDLMMQQCFTPELQWEQLEWMLTQEWNECELAADAFGALILRCVTNDEDLDRLVVALRKNWHSIADPLSNLLLVTAELLSHPTKYLVSRLIDRHLSERSSIELLLRLERTDFKPSNNDWKSVRCHQPVVLAALQTRLARTGTTQGSAQLPENVFQKVRALLPSKQRTPEDVTDWCHEQGVFGCFREFYTAMLAQLTKDYTAETFDRCGYLTYDLQVVTKVLSRKQQELFFSLDETLDPISDWLASPNTWPGSATRILRCLADSLAPSTLKQFVQRSGILKLLRKRSKDWGLDSDCPDLELLVRAYDRDVLLQDWKDTWLEMFIDGSFDWCCEAEYLNDSAKTELNEQLTRWAIEGGGGARSFPVSMLLYQCEHNGGQWEIMGWLVDKLLFQEEFGDCTEERGCAALKALVERYVKSPGDIERLSGLAMQSDNARVVGYVVELLGTSASEQLLEHGNLLEQQLVLKLMGKRWQLTPSGLIATDGNTSLNLPLCEEGTEWEVMLLAKHWPANLEEIAIDRCKGMAADVWEAALSQLPADLKTLRLEISDDITAEDIQAFEHIPPKLKKLIIVDSGYNALASQAAVSTIAKHLPPCLEYLHLASRNLDDIGLAAIAEKLTLGLRSIHLGAGELVTDRGVKSLAKALPSTLVECAFIFNAIDIEEGAGLLIQKLPAALEYLAVTAMLWKPKGKNLIAHALPEKLQKLDLDGYNDVSSEEFELLATGLPRQLQELILSGFSGITGKGIRLLPRDLQALVFDWCVPDLDSDSSALADQLPKLKRLEIVACGAATLEAPLGHLPAQLEYLSVERKPLQNNDLAALASNIPLTLTTLKLPPFSSNVTAQTSCLLFSQLPEKLKVLKLERIEDAEGDSLASLLENLPPHLERLTLKILQPGSSELLKLLAKLPPQTSLQYLHLVIDLAEPEENIKAGVRRWCPNAKRIIYSHWLR